MSFAKYMAVVEESEEVILDTLNICNNDEYAYNM